MPSDRRKATGPLVIAAIAAVLTLGLVLAPLLMGGSSDTAESDLQEQSADTGSTESQEGKDDALTDLERRTPDDPMAVGDVDAPVVMINYSEFQCPFCGKFARDTKPELMQRFVEDGTLRIEWRDFPYLGTESTRAAEAGRAAAAQGSFWEYHDALFADQAPPNSGQLTEDHLVGVAGDIGLDEKQFRADMTSGEVAKAVKRDFQEGQSIGVTGTPAFLVNGEPIMGAQPTNVFVDAIEKAAEQAR